MQDGHIQFRKGISVAALIAAVFVLHLLTPLGVTEGVFFLPAIWLAASLRSERIVYAVTALCMGLTLVASFFPAGDYPWDVTSLNLAAGLVAQGTVACLAVKSLQAARLVRCPLDAVPTEVVPDDRLALDVDNSRTTSLCAEGKVLNQAHQALLAGHGFDHALIDCLQLICRKESFCAGHFLLQEATSQLLVSSNLWYIADPKHVDTLSRLFRGRRYSRDHGLIARAWQSGPSIGVENVWEEQYFPASAAPTPLLRSAVIVPIRIRDRTTALLELFSDPQIPCTSERLQSLEWIPSRLSHLLEHYLLEQQQARLNLIVESSPDAIITKDIYGMIMSWNGGATAIYGYTAEDAIGNQTSLLLPHGQEEEEPEILDAIWAGKRLSQYRAVRQNRSGMLFDVLITISPLLDSRGQVVGSTSLERLLPDPMPTPAFDASDMAQRVHGEFLSNVSHELRTPMNAILGMLQLGLETELPPPIRDYLQTAQHSAYSLHHLLSDILDLSRVNSGAFELNQETFDLRRLIAESVDLLAPIAQGKELTLSWEADDELPNTLVGDPARFKQLLVNLLSNAVKFTQQGSVAIKITQEGRDDNVVTLRCSVRDTGIGIAEEHLQRIFNAFTQVDSSNTRNYQGVGLGLAISRHILRQMDGEFAVASTPGIGSEFSFTVTLPWTKRASHPIPERAERPLKILLAEDTPANQKVVTALLGARGHFITVAQNGREAEERALNEPFDLILMDVQMPLADGYEVTTAIRRAEGTTGGHLPIIAMTAHAMQGDRQRCLEIGMDAYLAKPLDHRRLIELVESLAPPASRHPPSLTSAECFQWTDPTETTTMPERAPKIFDLEGMLRRMRNDQAFVREFVKLFDEDAPTLIREIEAAIQASDAPALRILAHSLKGLASNFGAENVQLVAYELEEAGRHDQLSGTAQLLERLKVEVERLSQALESLR